MNGYDTWVLEMKAYGRRNQIKIFDGFWFEMCEMILHESKQECPRDMICFGFCFCFFFDSSRPGEKKLFSNSILNDWMYCRYCSLL